MRQASVWEEGEPDRRLVSRDLRSLRSLEMYRLWVLVFQPGVGPGPGPLAVVGVRIPARIPALGRVEVFGVAEDGEEGLDPPKERMCGQ